MESESSLFESADDFVRRHIGPRADEIAEMLRVVGASSLDQLIQNTIPAAIQSREPLPLGKQRSEYEVLERLKLIASKNRVCRSYIGMGYHDCITPAVIRRNILENPGWYTQYTPYQAEISQGRLEALLNFQTMVSDLTGMDIANASMLDEATAVAEAMCFAHRVHPESERNKIFVSDRLHPQTIAVIETRAEPLQLGVVIGDLATARLGKDYFAAVIQYPDTHGEVVDHRDFAETVHAAGALVIVASDLLALTVLESPGSWGADIVVGNSQRFGVPLGFGGPHAAFFATKDTYKRELPGRLVGVSKDRDGKPAYRLSLQTREQHIKRERATSNICTAQVLLAVMAATYAVYHGPNGLRRIAKRVHRLTCVLAAGLERMGFKLGAKQFFDTISIELPDAEQTNLRREAEAAGINVRYVDAKRVGISLDETVTEEDLQTLLAVFSRVTKNTVNVSPKELARGIKEKLPATLSRKTPFLTHPVFNSYHSETELLRYLRRLEAKDLSLTTAMIPLGSCTMKLNAAVEMLPVTWEPLSRLHPFVPVNQAQGYVELIGELESELATITGFAAASVQPNAGSQGEYAGLLCVRKYHLDRGDTKRTVCLIPQSAHGTNPASAVLVGMRVVVVACDERGNISLEDLKAKCEEHSKELSCLMVTYPSTHGVFEEEIKEICSLVHSHGGQVYMDGANLNAQVGLCSPGDIGADVCHINLHKTFCIPHGGGGPGVGPIAVQKHLVPFLPRHIHGDVGGERGVGAVSAAPWGSASILPISWTYIQLMGGEGLTEATKVAILNANYIAARLEPHFPVLYRGARGTVAHECILDLRKYKKTIGIGVEDVAKRLMDFGFHAPTVSFPVVETLMIEPTESESKAELDRFCDAMIAIREEIAEVERGELKPEESPLTNAPHTALEVCGETWTRRYTREQAAFPKAWLRAHKFWPSVKRIDSTYGDRNLVCSCPPLTAYT